MLKVGIIERQKAMLLLSIGLEIYWQQSVKIMWNSINNIGETNVSRSSVFTDAELEIN